MLAVRCQLFMFSAVHCQLMHYDCSQSVLCCSLPAWTTFSVVSLSRVHCHMVQITVHCQWLACCALPARCVHCHMVQGTVRCQCLLAACPTVSCGFGHVYTATWFESLCTASSQALVVRFAAACTKYIVPKRKGKMLQMMFINSLLTKTARASP